MMLLTEPARNRRKGCYPAMLTCTFLLSTLFIILHSGAALTPPSTPASCPRCAVGTSKPNARPTSIHSQTSRRIHCQSHTRATSSSRPSSGLRGALRKLVRLLQHALGLPSLQRAYQYTFQTSTTSVDKHTRVNCTSDASKDAANESIDVVPVEIDPLVREWVSRVKEGRLTPEEKRAFLSDTLSGRHTWSNLRNKPEAPVTVPVVSALASSGTPLYTSSLFGNRTTRVTLADTLSPAMVPNRQSRTEEPWLDNTVNDALESESTLVETVLDSPMDESELHRQSRAYREQQRARMYEIANQKLLSSVATLMAVPKSNPPDANLERTWPRGLANEAPPPAVVTAAPILQEYAVIDESRTIENYWRKKMVQQQTAPPRPVHAKRTLPRTVGPTEQLKQVPRRVADNAPTEQRQVKEQPAAPVMVEPKPQGLSTTAPPTFSYLKSFMSEPATAASPEPRPLPFLKDLPRREVNDPALVALSVREGAIRMPIPFETTDPGRRTLEEDRKARQSIRDAMTRSLTTTVSQDSRAKKWGIDMDKL